MFEVSDQVTDTHFGALPPRYGFMLNPYPDQRLSSCPVCDGKTGQRKLPLVIHIDPGHFVLLNYTCRYCGNCELLVAHKPVIEHLLTLTFHQRGHPEAIGNPYLILGTMDKKHWRESLTQPKGIMESLDYISDFAVYYEELRMTQGGWFPKGQKPPIWQSPPSQEWVRPKR